MPLGKKNAYTCQACKKAIITVDVDEGTTPFMILCYATPGCDGVMYSAFYSIPQSLPATFEWFKPASFVAYKDEELEHLKKGGLLMRPLQKNFSIPDFRAPSPFGDAKDRRQRQKMRKRHA